MIDFKILFLPSPHKYEKLSILFFNSSILFIISWLPETFILPKSITGDTNQKYELQFFIQYAGLDFVTPGNYAVYQKVGDAYFRTDSGNGFAKISKEEFLNEAKTAYVLKYGKVKRYTAPDS